MGNKLSIGIHYGCTFQTQQWLVVGWLSKINNHELLYYCLFWGGIATLAHTYIFNIFHRKIIFELEKKEARFRKWGFLTFLWKFGIKRPWIRWVAHIIVSQTPNLNSKFSQFSNKNENHLVEDREQIIPNKKHYCFKKSW